jgi:hypothetical protein
LSIYYSNTFFLNLSKTVSLFVWLKKINQTKRKTLKINQKKMIKNPIKKRKKKISPLDEKILQNKKKHYFEFLDKV